MEKLKLYYNCSVVYYTVVLVMGRLGVVGITEPSVIIAVSSAHRKESLEASILQFLFEKKSRKNSPSEGRLLWQAVHFAIDKLKATVPIWKKEVYADGEPAWKENKECMWSSQGAGHGT